MSIAKIFSDDFLRSYQALLFTSFSVTQPKFIPDCLRQWEFGLYVSGFWHIYAKTPRGIVICEQ